MSPSNPSGGLCEVDAVRTKLLADAAAWAGNVSTSVAIVFVNKLLMNVFHCHFATTLVRGAIKSPSAV